MHFRVDDLAAAERRPNPLHGRALSVAVVGGGIAGLTAARALQQEGHRVLVLDRGRRPAGRTSTRRSERFAFDHGAQYFTARDPRFLAEVERWTEERFVAPWTGRIVRLDRDGEVEPTDGSTMRYVGIPGMSALAGYLASELELENDAEVTHLRRAAGGWRVLGEQEDYGAFDRVVLAVPAPRAAALLDVAPDLQAEAARVRFRPAWAVMLGLAGPYAVEFDGAFVDESDLSWVARDSSKPGRGAREAWVLHGAPAWSAAHAAAAPETVVERLTRELVRRTGVELPEVLHVAARYWRYALPDPPLTGGALSRSELGLAVAGDWCASARVEGAYLSGLEAAERLAADPVFG